jgi:transcriptional regulator with XRE-family HTH domain
MPEFNSNLAQVLHYHRKKSGLSRIELAKLAGVGKRVVFDLEHQKETVQLDSLRKVLAALNIQIKFESPLMEQFQKENFPKEDQ